MTDTVTIRQQDYNALVTRINDLQAQHDTVRDGMDAVREAMATLQLNSSAGEPEPPLPSIMPFGPYLARMDEGRMAADIIRSGVPVFLIDMGPNESKAGVIVQQALADNPDRIVIVRNTRMFRVGDVGPEVALEHQWLKGAQGAIDYYNYIVGKLRAWGLTPEQRRRVFVMPVNEWDGLIPAPEKFSDARANALRTMDAFYLQFMNLMQAEGFRVCLYSLPEGNPEKSEWEYCRNSITNAALYGHIVGMHSYFEGHNGAHGYTDEAYILRYRWLWQKCDEWGIARVRVVLTELALTSALNNGVGYRGMGMPIADMMAHLAATAAALIQDGVLACIFAQSPYDPPWGTFDYGYDRDAFYDTLSMWNGTYVGAEAYALRIGGYTMEFLTKFWAWFKSLPIIGPILSLLNSRKFVIAAALVALLVKSVPFLTSVSDELTAVLAVVIGTGLLALANILGIALEDYAAKRNG